MFYGIRFVVQKLLCKNGFIAIMFENNHSFLFTLNSECSSALLILNLDSRHLKKKSPDFDYIYFIDPHTHTHTYAYPSTDPLNCF